MVLLALSMVSAALIAAILAVCCSGWSYPSELDHSPRPFERD